MVLEMCMMLYGKSYVSKEGLLILQKLSELMKVGIVFNISHSGVWQYIIDPNDLTCMLGLIKQYINFFNWASKKDLI